MSESHVDRSKLARSMARCGVSFDIALRVFLDAFPEGDAQVAEYQLKRIYEAKELVE